MVHLFQIEDSLAGEHRFIYQDKEYTTIEAVKNAADRPERLVVKELRADGSKMLVTVMDNPIAENAVDTEWEKQYIQKFGCRPSFF